MWSNDPVMDAENYTDERDSWIESRPVCCECGDHITSEWRFFIGGKYYCERCMDDHRELND